MAADLRQLAVEGMRGRGASGVILSGDNRRKDPLSAVLGIVSTVYGGVAGAVGGLLSSKKKEKQGKDRAFAAHDMQRNRTQQAQFDKSLTTDPDDYEGHLDIVDEYLQGL